MAHHRIETRNSVADISRAQSELGFDPEADFDTAILQVLEEIRAKSGA